eukprot:SAG31_NODE_384_length_16414_cov_7.492308_11_plen_80_part_00
MVCATKDADGHEMYILAAGHAEARIDSVAGPVAVYSAGDYFGGTMLPPCHACSCQLNVSCLHHADNYGHCRAGSADKQA